MHSQKRRPRLPREFYTPSPLFATMWILASLLAFWGCGAAAGWLATSEAPAALQWIAVPLLVVVAGHGVHLAGWVGHEGFHLSLTSNKYVSALLATVFSTITLNPAVGYAISHYNHHRFTNQSSDPDAQLFPGFRTFWSRLFGARSAVTRLYFRLLLDSALRRPKPGYAYPLPFPPAFECALAWLNIAMVLLWLGVYVALAIQYPVFVLVGLVLPLIVGVPLSGLRIFVEHAETGEGEFGNSRSYTSPLYTLALFGNNYHLEHHLYPGVPCFRLPAVHRFLKERGYFERPDAPIDPSLLGPLRLTTGRAQYPDPLASDTEADPFERAIQGA